MLKYLKVSVLSLFLAVSTLTYIPMGVPNSAASTVYQTVSERVNKPFDPPFVVCDNPGPIKAMFEAWDADKPEEFSMYLQMAEAMGQCVRVNQPMVLETEGMVEQTKSAKQLNKDNPNQYHVARMYKIFYQGNEFYVMTVEVNNKSQ